jgi:hypothetical protein
MNMVSPGSPMRKMISLAEPTFHRAGQQRPAVRCRQPVQQRPRHDRTAMAWRIPVGMIISIAARSFEDRREVKWATHRLTG